MSVYRLALFIVMVLAHPCAGLQWPEWPQSLQEVKSLLYEATDKLNTAFEAISKAEKFIDASLEEDCPFLCPGKDQVPRPRKGYVKSRCVCSCLMY